MVNCKRKILQANLPNLLRHLIVSGCVSFSCQIKQKINTFVIINQHLFCLTNCPTIRTLLLQPNNLSPGKKGIPGESGGNIFVKFLNSTNYERLKFYNDGGKGGDGQDGGDGADGQPGKNARPRWTKDKLVKLFPSTATWSQSRHLGNSNVFNFSREELCRQRDAAETGVETGLTVMDESITLLSRTKKTFGFPRRHFLVHVCGKTFLLSIAF